MRTTLLMCKVGTTPTSSFLMNTTTAISLPLTAVLSLRRGRISLSQQLEQCTAPICCILTFKRHSFLG